MPALASPVGAARFRAAFRQLAAGVVVVTFDAGGPPAGVTVTSFASVSLEPPLGAFAISTSASIWPHLLRAGTAVVNLLAHDQHELATRFATSGIDRFAPPVAWHRLATGEPVLDGPGHRLRATVRERRPVGDHHLVVVEIVEVLGGARTALVYHDGAYHGVRADG